jgi:hypothetical protein
MHTPSDLIGHPISEMASSQNFHTTTITQDTLPTSPTLQMEIYFIPFTQVQSSARG